MHVLGSIHNKPNSINGLPPFTLNKNQIITINPPKNQELFYGCNLKNRGKLVRQKWAREIKGKAKRGKRPTQFQL